MKKASVSRRTFLQASGALAAGTMIPPGTRASNRKAVTREVFADKVRGMILLGAYGDALGAPHELGQALSGEIGDLAVARRLQPSRSYFTTPQEWGIWPDADEFDLDQKGLPTDDTGYRVAILQDWLCTLAGTGLEPTEVRFERWMVGEVRRRSRPEGGWRLRRWRQIQTWLAMFGDARRWADQQRYTPLGQTPDPAGFQSQVDHFYRPDQAIVFGLFMYLELAAIYCNTPTVRVAERFSTFSSLDMDHGRVATGLFAGLVAEAINADPTAESFDGWYTRHVRGILDMPIGDVADREVLREAFADIQAQMPQWKTLSETAFLERMQRDIYAPGVQASVFDPLLFFRQITAAVLYAGENPHQALQLLAASPGDADTVPSFLGTVVGAWYGEQALRTYDPIVAQDLSAQGAFLETVFETSLADRIACFSALAEAHGGLE